jgi:hypothetical protein
VRARQLAACLERYQGQPDYWARDVRRALDLAVSAAHDQGLPPVDDLPRTLAEPERRLLTRHLVLSFGRLMCAWSEIVAAAGELGAEGARLTEPVRPMPPNQEERT